MHVGRAVGWAPPPPVGWAPPVAWPAQPPVAWPAQQVARVAARQVAQPAAPVVKQAPPVGQSYGGQSQTGSKNPVYGNLIADGRMGLPPMSKKRR